MSRVVAALRGLGPRDGEHLWHVSPFIDMTAYHFSWLWVLIPLSFFGSLYPKDFIWLFVLIMIANFAHRHFTLPYVYLDRQVFAQYPFRFVVFPLLMFALFLASPWLWTHGYAKIVSVSAFLAVLWNLWHIHMQKFGILRLYDAKARRAGSDAGASRRIDALLVFGWLPFYLIYLGPAHRDLLLEHAPTIQESTMPLVDRMAQWQPWLLPPAIALIVLSIALFVRQEWRVRRLRNRPRCSLALGLTLLPACFLVFDPVKVALAYVFTHAVEYMVFVWAFQRRRYAQPLVHRPILGRLLRRSFASYAIFLLVLAGVYFLTAFYGRYFFRENGSFQIAGVSARRWIFYWGIFQSMVHFYFDGFLWKMRLPIYRESI